MQFQAPWDPWDPWYKPYKLFTGVVDDLTWKTIVTHPRMGGAVVRYFCGDRGILMRVLGFDSFHGFELEKPRLSDY